MEDFLAQISEGQHLLGGEVANFGERLALVEREVGKLIAQPMALPENIPPAWEERIGTLIQFSHQGVAPVDLSAILQGVGVLQRRLEALEREASEPKPSPQSMDLVALTQLEQRMTNMEVAGGETHKMVLGVHRELQKHATYLAQMGGAMIHLGKQTESVSSKMQSMRDEVQKAFREFTQRI